MLESAHTPKEFVVTKMMQSLAALILVFGVAGQALAEGPVFTARFSDVAIRGYDPVAYFTDGKPVKGSQEFSTEWNGATWQFASAEHLETFKAGPEKYAPAYGGYCAWAVATKKQKAPTDPAAWSIVDGRLFLNYDKSIQKKWDADRPGFIKTGDQHWPEVVGK